MECRLLGHRTENLTDLPCIVPNVLAHHPYLATGWDAQAADHIDGGRFTRPVRSQQPKNLPLLYTKREVIYCPKRPKSLTKISHFYCTALRITSLLCCWCCLRTIFTQRLPSFSVPRFSGSTSKRHCTIS